MHADSKPLYRHSGVALLRAAARPLDHAPDGWPDPSDTQACRDWLRLVWSRPDLADAIRQASSTLADRLDAIHVGKAVPAKQIRRATLAAVRYVLRATGRHTPFGLFAGLAEASVGSRAEVHWGDGHRPVACVDTQWLADVIDRMEACPELLERMDVVFTNLAIQRGRRLEAPRGPNRVTIRFTSAVQAVQDIAQTPIRFGDLADKLAETFPAASPATVRALLTELGQQGVLITCLRAPMTITDPLSHLIDRLNSAGADTIADAAPVLDELLAVQTELRRCNDPDIDRAEQSRISATITSRMRELSRAGRTTLAVHLLLDCNVQLPEHVAREMETAADALARLTRQPTGEAAWRDFYTAFCDRYGSGTLVPLLDVVDPDTGLGFPAGYPGSVLPARTSGGSERDEKLVALAWNAMADGSQEIILNEKTIQSLAVGDPSGELHIPPHVEFAARIHATSTEALERGDYVLTIAPARSFGTLTSRFTAITMGSRLQDMYAAAPTAIAGALPVQLSFPPAYPHAQNICRVPAYLPHVLSLGEHRGCDDTTITLEDLAVTANRDGLYLVSISRGRVVDPQVYHGLALQKQPPPLARFLIHLSRGFGASWHKFDWGPHSHLLPYLPRVRYCRAILAPARWRLTSTDLPADADQDQWRQELGRWRRRWRCPGTLELSDADRTLRLDLGEPAHATILHAHLKRHGHATLTETVTDPADYGWIDGHAHEIVLPLVTTRPAAPSPVAVARPVVTNRAHGQLPGSPDAAWLNAKIYTHPERLDEIITDQLPRLLDMFDWEPACWFIRYRSPRETDHLRLRIRTLDCDANAASIAAVGAWAQQLRSEGVTGRLVFDTYQPETGRYGHGLALAAGEEVFVADSRTVAAQLRRLSEQVIHRNALAAVNMVATIEGFLGGTERAMRWLIARPAPAASTGDRAALDRFLAVVGRRAPQELSGWAGTVAATWQARAAALATYRARLPVDADTDTIAESLLHMHYNRLVGIDRDREATCRRLARHAALAWIAQQGGDR